MPELPESESQITAKTLRRADGRSTGRPFVKGFDPRRNMSGKPKSFDSFRELAQSIAGEELEGKDGRKMLVAEALLRKCARSDEPTLIKTFFEYAFGKVPDKLETTGLEHKTSVVLYFDHEVRDNPELKALFESNGR